MKEKVKKPVKLEVRDYIHKWCNNLITDENFKSRVWEGDANHLWYNNSLVAEKVAPNKIIVLKFDNHGAYGNGYGHYVITSSIPKNVSFILVNNLFSRLSEERYKTLLRNLVENAVNDSRSLMYLAYIKHKVKDNKTREFTDWSVIEKLNLSFFKGFLSAKEIKSILNTKYFIRPYYKKHKGWGKYDYESFTMDSVKVSYNDMITKDFKTLILEFLGKDYLDNFEFKLWRNKQKAEQASTNYRNNKIERKQVFYSTTLLAKEAYFKCKETRLEFEEEVKNWKVRVEESSKYTVDRFNLEKARKEAEKNKKLAESFYKGSFVRLFENFQRVVLKNDYEVKTSSGAVVPLEDARKAYQYLIRSEKVQKVGGYTVLGIDKGTFYECVENKTYKDHPFIKIGCHTIPLFEAENFVKRHNLNW